MAGLVGFGFEFGGFNSLFERRGREGVGRFCFWGDLEAGARGLELRVWLAGMAD